MTSSEWWNIVLGVTFLILALVTQVELSNQPGGEDQHGPGRRKPRVDYRYQAHLERGNYPDELRGSSQYFDTTNDDQDPSYHPSLSGQDNTGNALAGPAAPSLHQSFQHLAIRYVSNTWTHRIPAKYSLCFFFLLSYLKMAFF